MDLLTARPFSQPASASWIDNTRSTATKVTTPNAATNVKMTNVFCGVIYSDNIRLGYKYYLEQVTFTENLLVYSLFLVTFYDAKPLTFPKED
jgi:hypothetical protein